jgi:hypothetical protein
MFPRGDSKRTETRLRTRGFMRLNALPTTLLTASVCALVLACGPDEGSCNTSADCADGQICNASGVCESQQAETCSRPGTCSGGLICDVSAGECGTAAACSAANPQPDTCPYGQFCGTGNCAEAPVAPSTCTNFGASAHALTWGTGKTGPVIYKITPRTTIADTAFCGGTSPNRYRVDVEAYWGPGTPPADDPAFEALLHIVGPTGTEVSTTDTVQNFATTNSRRNVTFTVNICRSASTAYSFGAHFIDGNEVCVDIPGP